MEGAGFMLNIRGHRFRLIRATAKLYRTGASALARRLVEHDHKEIGVPPFDEMTVHQRLATLAIVSREILSPARPTVFPTVYLESAIAAVMKHAEQATAQETHFLPDLAVDWPKLIRSARRQVENKFGGRRWTIGPPGAEELRDFRGTWTLADWSWIEWPSAETLWRDQREAVIAPYDDQPPAFWEASPPDPTPEEMRELFAFLEELGGGFTPPSPEGEGDHDAMSNASATRARRRVRI